MSALKLAQTLNDLADLESDRDLNRLENVLGKSLEVDDTGPLVEPFLRMVERFPESNGDGLLEPLADILVDHPSFANALKESLERQVSLIGLHAAGELLHRGETEILTTLRSIKAPNSLAPVLAELLGRLP